jgi:hypothetical protein
LGVLPNAPIFGEIKNKKIELKTQKTSQFKPFKSKTQKQIHFCGQP